MKIIAIVCAVFWALTIIAYYAAEHAPSDDFGAGVLVWALGLVAILCTIALFCVWMWT